MNGEIDCAIHSAKDIPEPVPAGLDWVWLPWKEDARDAIVLPKGLGMKDLPVKPVVGVSSDRRERYCLQRFSAARLKNIRGGIESRLAQLDAGEYDCIIMAGAALNRLGLQNRISEWIPLDTLEAPEGQGVLAVTFKTGNPFFLRLRSLFVHCAVFAGAGAGSAGMCSMDVVSALRHCDVCLYDSLIDPLLLEYLPAHASRRYVGKRAGAHSTDQIDINQLIADSIRKGYAVVRLKGGDPGIFGRLAEEIDMLDSLQLPYRVLPGISSLVSATTGSGMLLTRRGVSQGFCVMTSRLQGGDNATVTAEVRGSLPIVFFMSVARTAEIAAELMQDGMTADTPAAVVFDAGSSDEYILRCELGNIGVCLTKYLQSRKNAESDPEYSLPPGLLLVGDITRFGYHHEWSALSGRRILLTCSRALQAKAGQIVRDCGGVPVPFPLIDLLPEPDLLEMLDNLQIYDWVLCTSPSSARIFMDAIEQKSIDLRSLPKLMVCGSGTAAEFTRHGIYPDLQPESDFSTEGLCECGQHTLKKGQKIARLRSANAGTRVAEFFRKRGIVVDDVIIYTNQPVRYEKLPAFDAVFFASGSAAESFLDQWGSSALEESNVLAIGTMTAAILEKNEIKADVISPDATVDGAIHALAAWYVNRDLMNE